MTAPHAIHGRRTLWALLPGLVVWGALAGCASDDDQPTTAPELCATIFELCDDGHGWVDEPTCAQSFLNDEALGTTCDQTDEYLICAADCTTRVLCANFESCESACWETHC